MQLCLLPVLLFARTHPCMPFAACLPSTGAARGVMCGWLSPPIGVSKQSLAHQCFELSCETVNGDKL